MTSAEQYRALAAKLRAKAAFAGSADLAGELEQLAQSYVRLAEQADKNALMDVAIEFSKARPLQGKGA